MKRTDAATAASRPIAERLREDSAALAKALQVSRHEAQRDVQILLSRALGWDLARLLTRPESLPDTEAAKRYESMLARRMAHEPVAYLLGEREFYSLLFEVSSAVLIPRPETELLVELALGCIPESGPCSVLDLGSGSGCIAVTVAKLRPSAQVLATDVSEAALAVLRRNASRHGVTNLDCAVGSWFGAVGQRCFDVIVSNPPYVAVADPHLRQADLRFEPRIALAAGPQGLDALREIIEGAPGHLRPGGWLLVEHGHDQADAVAALMGAAGFEGLFSHRDLAGIPRVAQARMSQTVGPK